MTHTFFESGKDFARALNSALEGSRSAQGRLKDVINDIQMGKYGVQESVVSGQLTDWFNVAVKPAFEKSYSAQEEIWSKVASEEKLNDFRPTRFYELHRTEASIIPTNGGHQVPAGTLPRIPELTPYPTFGYQASGKWVSTAKHGVRLQLSWEAFLNDDWGLIARFPQDGARLASRTKDVAVLGTLFSLDPATAGFNPGVIGDNLGTVLQARQADDAVIFSDVRKNAALSLDSLNAAIKQVSEARDAEGNPVAVNKFALIVPTALKPVAERLVGLGGLEREVTDAKGKTKFQIGKAVAGDVEVVASDLVGILGGATQGSTNWVLAPYGGKTAVRRTLVRTTLLGYDSPELRMANAAGTSLGGGAIKATDGSFDNDDIQARVRLVTGGAILNSDGIIASTGQG